MLFNHYTRHMQSDKPSENILTILQNQVKYDNINFHDVFLKLNSSFFYKAFKLTDQIITINKVIDKYVGLARLNESHYILKI